MKFQQIIIIFCSIIILTSCESDVERNKRLAQEEVQRIELETKLKKEADELAFQQEQERLEIEKQEEAERIEREITLKKEREEKAIYNKYINNSLNTGSTPYSYCFGSNKPCSERGCAGISVKTPYNSDVMVTIKKDDKVFRHTFIKAGDTYKFQFPNGTYQAFFYYGKGWNPNKIIKKVDCGILKGGFIANESFSKDKPQNLTNAELSYELILQEDGNFSTKPSNSDEAF
ncbi:hypothetical protein ESY86_19100 [Subsaximicrobium wynnwilliamsii]|uniref:Lipoprotein n=1 Tax=Subsaximicrobium wynnwilliamsii TaxID=291179 RepID=A0A5C6ZBA7_9FLAO|nr:hypothetical protein [Subsaximicrobium wynnwilliamsii]TXD81127.1 hypothetical protein ESY87_19300 [Subsaximicrobium wynnwilliamsii]TXD86864.1 hypothetical protein ESY86_19100 [Subsaximicrobium wynnwilliamsii]TXE00455.1 hypothetical protein ESY88_19285 [Subsaximicrobium wynnwilliamsii]